MTEEEYNAAMARTRARPYDMKDPAELQRLYRECRGYLKLCHHKHGTDWEGRQFAMDALEKLAASEGT
jgi:uncharacterized protein Smg (DUF494 family)